MRKSWLTLSLAVAGVLGGAAYLALAAGGDEATVTLDSLPAPVKAAILRQSGGAALTELEREMRGKEAVYEAEWVVNGVEHEAAFAADGALLETEDEITLEQTPPAVRTAIVEIFGASVKVSVAKKTIVVYEAEGKVDGKAKEVIVLPTGQVHGPNGSAPTSEHKDDDEDDDDGEDDDN